MLSIYLAISALMSPVGLEGAALTRCAPDKHTACHRPARAKRKYTLRPGKRCHPDPSKAVGCREIFVSADSRKTRDADAN